MKQKGIFLVLAICVAISVISCSQNGDSMTEGETAGSSANIEISILESQLDALTLEKADLERTVARLSEQLDEANDLLFRLENESMANHSVQSLLQDIVLGEKTVSRFYGIIDEIMTGDVDGRPGFIFKIDEISVNPNWDGPGSDGENGFYLNPDSETTQHQGSFLVTFAGFGGYISSDEKEEDVLHGSCNRTYVGNSCLFYTVDHEIVYIRQEGP